ncbi:general substrate transporter [Gautieria morchelliformis]|nr:general substrate transporter [Gautieria morchelliformis]
MAPQSSTLSSRGWQTAVWMLVTSLQYGWHISALNQIQDVLTCGTTRETPPSSRLPSCIPMSKFAFTLVTSSFIAGGLLGSIAANYSMESFGRKGSIRINTLLIFLGSSIMTVSASVPPLVIGRFLIGAGSGLGLCVVPAYLSEISPPAIRGSIGVLNQLGIVLGIFITQALGIVLAAPSLWRLVPLIAAAVALAQLLLSFVAVDSPAWLSSKARLPEAKASAALLWGDQTLVPTARPSQDSSREEEALLSNLDADTPLRPVTAAHDPLTFHQLLRPPLLRPLLIVCFGMIAQQISGINAVLYYSNDILSRVMPDAAAYVSLGVTVINVLMTFPPIYLIERIGRRSLVTISTVGALLSLLGVGYGINGGHIMLASVAIITFVASYAVGLGPVPFVIIPDVSPIHAVSSLSSIALSLNWIANFFVGIGFIPLRDFLAGEDDHRNGRVFYVFAAILLAVYLAWSKAYTG